MMLLEMVYTFFKIGLFTIGGGYAMIPLITQFLVDNNWMTTSEIADIIAIAKMTPGPFAVNTATFAGMKIYGLTGAIACTFGVILPSLIITVLVAKFFFDFQHHKLVQGALSGIRPTVVALIASAIVSVSLITLFKVENLNEIVDGIKNIEAFSIVILAISLYLLIKRKVHPIIVIVLSGALSVVFYMLLPNIIAI